MSEQKSKTLDEDLDDLLSMRGKPFADWKEERKYLREKWGMQGRQIEVDPPESDHNEKEEKKK